MNLFQLPVNLPDEELVETLCTGSARVERIISGGQCSPEGFWYDQQEDEWVSVLAGEAVLLLEETGPLRMKAGDTVFIPAHKRHRVEWTSKDPACVWLCVFGSLNPCKNDCQ